MRYVYHEIVGDIFESNRHFAFSLSLFLFDDLKIDRQI
jgi:hypothetical protein